MNKIAEVLIFFSPGVSESLLMLSKDRNGAACVWIVLAMFVRTGCFFLSHPLKLARAFKFRAL